MRRFPIPSYIEKRYDMVYKKYGVDAAAEHWNYLLNSTSVSENLIFSFHLKQHDFCEPFVRRIFATFSLFRADFPLSIQTAAAITTTTAFTPSIPTWTEWSAWSSCSASCSVGFRSKRRQCVRGGELSDVTTISSFAMLQNSRRSRLAYHPFQRSLWKQLIRTRRMEKVRTKRRFSSYINGHVVLYIIFYIFINVLYPNFFQFHCIIAINIKAWPKTTKISKRC